MKETFPRLRVANYILQWFFIRLTLCCENEVIGLKLDSACLLADGTNGFAFRDYEIKTKSWLAIQGWIVPLTGWRKDSRFVGKPWLKQVTKPN